MATVYEIAAQIKRRLGAVDRFRLLKLVYYVQAWSLVYRQRPAFLERIEAWPNGPVARNLWTDLEHHGASSILAAMPLQSEDALDVENVLAHFGHLSGPELVDLTHAEAPWANARRGLKPSESSTREITHEAIRSYYSAAWAEAAEDNDTVMNGPSTVHGGVDDLYAFVRARQA